MAKKNNSPKAPAAPKTEQPQSTTVVNNNVTGFNTPAAYMQGLDPNHQVDLTKMMHETFRMDPNAAKKYNMSDETVAAINEANAIAQVCILANEVAFAQNPFAIRMKESQLKALQQIANTVGVSINLAALPAPNKEGTVEIPSTAVEVSDETKKKLETERKMEEKLVELDPTKIENDEQLAEALKKIMTDRKNIIEKIQHPIDFFLAYKKIQASKAENKDEELSKLNAMTRPQVFEELAKFLGTAPLVISGVGGHMFTITAGTKSPVYAFSMLRNAAKDRKTGTISIDDQTIADYVRIIVKWVGDLRIAENEKKLTEITANVEALSKDAKKNKKAIDEQNEKKATIEGNISHLKDVQNYVMNPTGDVPDNWPAQFKEKDSAANRIYGAVINTYYDDIEVKEMKRDGVLHNVQQYIGIIHNMFRAPGDSLQNYSEANILALEPIGETTTSTNEEPKND